MLNPSKVAKKEKKKQFDPKRKQVVSTMKIKVLKWQFYACFLWCLVEVLGEDFDFEGASTMSLTCCSWFYMVLSEWEGGHGRSTWRMNLLWRLRSVSLCGSGEGQNELFLAILYPPLYLHPLHVILSFFPTRNGVYVSAPSHSRLHHQSASANRCKQMWSKWYLKCVWVIRLILLLLCHCSSRACPR